MNLTIQYNHPLLDKIKLTGRVKLDCKDWTDILSAIDVAGYNVVKKEKSDILTLNLSDNITLTDGTGGN